MEQKITFKSIVDNISHALVNLRVFPAMTLVFFGYISLEVITWAMQQGLSGSEFAMVVGSVLVPAAAYGQFYVTSGKNSKQTK